MTKPENIDTLQMLMDAVYDLQMQLGGPDDEITAMGIAYAAFQEVPYEAIPRCLHWLQARLEHDENKRRQETSESSNRDD